MITTVQSLLGNTDTPALPAIPASLFYRTEGYSVGELGIDLILSESHALSSVVTSHPVEDGSVITDHIQKNLRMGSLQARISNHSRKAAQVNTESTEIQDVIDANTTAMKANRAMAAWELLQAIHDRSELVTIVTVLQKYTDVAITDINVDRDSETGEALDFTISFQQVKRVALKEVTVTAVIAPKDMKSPINRDAAVKINRGQVVGDTTYMDMSDIIVEAK